MSPPDPSFPVDLEALLAPISVDRPGGENLRYEGTHDRIQEARREEDASLPQGVWKTTPKRAEWRQVESLCQEALRTRSKDLRIAGWLLEAWLELQGLRGLEVGLRLMAGLVERFWENAWPALEPADPTGRLSPVEWVDDKLALRLKSVPLTRPESPEAGEFSYADWETAVYRERAPKPSGPSSKSVEAPVGVTQARFTASMSLTPAPVIASMIRDLDAALDAAEGVARGLNTRLGQEQGMLLKLKAALTGTRNLIQSLRGPVAASAMATAGAAPEVEAALAPVSQQGAGPIQSRAEAYRRLSEVADFLMRSEPHSPTPYLIKRAISWGDMPLGELLQEIVQTPQDLKAIQALLGMR
ncbi:type VI secretion system protein TssA [Corallococcus sp. BB11-1]|uniref:type VI secretion system protein TssA n=1 Tax=Corallococcus sp. BB11-1 TaxID=2996783 RepID=UPI00226DAC35|nr:type VI secretion system protein TssA [Corallococcus sp. BB11-1]MCY1033888.1 type VI secretion system protein TssA [Corallococcus sp. BB11-1]